MGVGVFISGEQGHVRGAAKSQWWSMPRVVFLRFTTYKINTRTHPALPLSRHQHGGKAHVFTFLVGRDRNGPWQGRGSCFPWLCPQDHWPSRQTSHLLFRPTSVLLGLQVRGWALGGCLARKLSIMSSGSSCLPLSVWLQPDALVMGTPFPIITIIMSLVCLQLNTLWTSEVGRNVEEWFIRGPQSNGGGGELF